MRERRRDAPPSLEPEPDAPSAEERGTPKSSGVYASPKLDRVTAATAAGSDRQTGHEAQMTRRKSPRPLALAPPAIVVVDDDLKVASALMRWLDLCVPDHVVVHAKNLTEARAAIFAQPTYAIFLDLHLGQEDGLDLLRELRDSGDETPVLIITGDAALSRLDDALELGASIAFKPFDTGKLTPFVVRSIERPRNQDVVLTVLATEAGLATREAETLFLIAEDQSNAEIATALDIAEGTAKKHAQAVFDKLGVHGRVELMFMVNSRLCPPILRATAKS